MTAHPTTGQLLVVVANNELLTPADLKRVFLTDY
jgi:hypothetical protein